MTNKVIQKGKKNPATGYYHLWLIGILIAVIIFLIKLKDKIVWRVFGIYLAITLPLCYLWQRLICHYKPDESLGISAWMFYRENIISNILFLGGVLEDMLIFHPVGMMFGYILAVHVFKIFKETKNTRPVLKIVTFSILFLILCLSAIFLDYSSRISFLVFALPGFIGFIFFWKQININRFIPYLLTMLVFVFVWDWTSVVSLELLGNKIAGNGEGIFWRAWFYIKNGIHSYAYSNYKWTWLFGKLPISIDIHYPTSGMILQSGLIPFLYWIFNINKCQK